jgi:ribosome-associated toxin RatA of RatAB toxin-antitoxin module
MDFRTKLKQVCLIGVFLYCLSAPLSAGENTVLYPGTDPWKILNKPEIISLDVYALREDPRIMLFADAHVSANIALYKLRSVIGDYGQYHRYFKRCSRSGIAARTEEGVFQELEMTVKLMGASFTGHFVVFVRELSNSSSGFSLGFTYTSETGTIRRVYGEWRFERIEPALSGARDNGASLGGLTYVRFILSGSTVRKIPFQKTAISLALGPEMISILEQLLAAAVNR